MKILITGYLGGEEGTYGNFGDEAIASSIISNIKKRKKDVKFTILSHNPTKSKKLHKVDAIKIPNLDRYWYKYNYNELWNTIKETDILILGGGQSMQDQPAWETICKHFIPTIFAKLQDKKVVYFGIGVGPLNRIFIKHLMKRVLNYVDLIITRDNESIKLLKELGKDKNIKKSFDPVLLFDTKKQIKEKSIGISARVYNLDEKKYKELSAFLNWLIEQNYNIKFFEIEDDKIVYNKLTKEVKKNDKFKIIPNTTAINKIIGEVGKCQFIIGMRFHILIAAFLHGIPFIGFNYCPKVKRFCKFSSQPNIDMKKIKFERLKKEFELIQKNEKKYHNFIRKKSKEVNESINESFDSLFKSNTIRTNLFNKTILIYSLTLIYIKLFTYLIYRLFTKHIFKKKSSFQSTC